MATQVAPGTTGIILKEIWGVEAKIGKLTELLHEIVWWIPANVLLPLPRTSFSSIGMQNQEWRAASNQ